MFDKLFGKNSENEQPKEESFNLSYLSARIKKVDAAPEEDEPKSKVSESIKEKLAGMPLGKEIEDAIEEATASCDNRDESVKETARKTFNIGRKMMMSHLKRAEDKVPEKIKQRYIACVNKQYDTLIENYDIFGTPGGLIFGKCVMDHEQHTQQAAAAAFSLIAKDAPIADKLLEMFVDKMESNTNDMINALKKTRELNKNLKNADLSELLGGHDKDEDDFGPSDDLRKLLGDEDED